MNRCSKIASSTVFIAACALLAGAGALFSSEVRAERAFPLKTERGQMAFIELPDVLINGKPERLAHSVRVRDERNAIVMPGIVNGRSVVVNYLRSPRGTVSDVWILSPQEAAIPLKPVPGMRRPAEPIDTKPFFLN